MGASFKVLLQLLVLLGGEGILNPKKVSFWREMTMPFEPMFLLLNGSNLKLSLHDENYEGSIIPCPNVTSVMWKENIDKYEVRAEIVFQKKEDFNFMVKKIARDERYKQN